MTALLNIGIITAEQHKDIRQTISRNVSDAAQNPEEVLLKMGLVTAEDILKAKASMYGMEFRRISPEKVNKLAFEKLALDFIKNNNVVPVDIEQDCLLIATSEPANVFVLEDVKRQTKMDIKTIVCTPGR
ncbi:unnamed protein product, partial [marine sediment metagenome]